MRVACLQFAPIVGDVAENIRRADRVLEAAAPEDLRDLDLLVLPELAFTGYNYESLHHIYPFLEDARHGVSAAWARATAIKYGCFVTVGYPETVNISNNWPADPEYYNSSVTFNGDGDEVAHYRKSHLYYTDETWALEGDGFLADDIPGLGRCAMGICMDINPYKFLASEWHQYEFANHVLDTHAELVILSNAWLTREDAGSYLEQGTSPDTDTLTYWIQRLGPLVVADTDYEIVVVIANRCGTEGDAVYAGTSTVLSIFKKKVKLYGILGRGISELLVVDTAKKPRRRIRLPPDLLEMATARRVDPEADEDAIDVVPFEMTSNLSTNLAQTHPDPDEDNEDTKSRGSADSGSKAKVFIPNHRFSSGTVFEDVGYYHAFKRDVDEQPE